MKVQELIKRLSALPPDAEIEFEGDIDDFLPPVPCDLEINIKNSWQLLPQNQHLTPNTQFTKKKDDLTIKGN